MVHFDAWTCHVAGMGNPGSDWAFQRRHDSRRIPGFGTLDSAAGEKGFAWFADRADGGRGDARAHEQTEEQQQAERVSDLAEGDYEPRLAVADAEVEVDHPLLGLGRLPVADELRVDAHEHRVPAGDLHVLLHRDRRRDERLIETRGDSRAYLVFKADKEIRKSTFVVAAGPAVNIALAFAILTFVYFVNAQQVDQGIVALDGGGLEGAAHEYFQQSEQIPTRLRLTAGPLLGPGPERRASQPRPPSARPKASV